MTFGLYAYVFYLILQAINCQFINAPPPPPRAPPPQAPVNRFQVPNARIPVFPGTRNSFNPNGVFMGNRQVAGNTINRNPGFAPIGPGAVPSPLVTRPVLFGSSALNMVPAPRVTGFPAQQRSWMPAAANTIKGHMSLVPTPTPDAGTITFKSISGAFPQVNIPANEKDDHHTEVKELFDRSYPNLPPLRRAMNQTALKLQSTSDGSSVIIGIMENDPLTVYVPYTIQGMEATAYLPFERDARQLKYPSRPIYLPYPPFAVRDPSSGKTYPMYLPFQINGFRKPGQEPYVLIPFLPKGSKFPSFDAFLPSREKNDVLPDKTIPPVSVISDQPEWNALKVKWGMNLTDPDHFTDLPRTENDALRQGYTMLSDCFGNPRFVGKRYWKNFDAAVILIYDINGYIAGIQAGIPAGLLNGYPTTHLTPRPFVFDDNRFLITVYFDNPGNICQSGRTQEQINKQGTGIDLYFQNGNDPLKDSVIVPREEAEIRKTLWTPTSCYPSMGQHFYYNLRSDMPCEEFAPLFLLYNNGRLKGFGWIFLSNIQSNRYEYPDTQDYTNYLGQMYPVELATESYTSASYLDLLLSIGKDDQLHTSLYGKRDDFNYNITNFPFLSSNIPSSSAYGVFISQLIRYARASSSYERFIL